MEDTLYRIALMMAHGITCKHFRKIYAHCGSAKEAFSLGESDLYQILGPRCHTVVASILSKDSMRQAEEELKFTERNHIEVLCMDDERYPQRLNATGCEDTPPLLYYKGNADLNRQHVVAIVGTRRATSYGQVETMRIVEQLRQYDDLLVVSGLAYGIDTAAHRNCVDKGIDTVGVLGHGFNYLYPSANRKLAREMVDGNGGLLTEYPSDTKMAPRLFPARNRIVAAMSDATIVVEAAEKGGALITAAMANGYHKDVFAVPGRNEDEYSRGCNNLIAHNQAHILRSADDLGEWMGWKKNAVSASPITQSLSFTEELEQYTPDEQKILSALVGRSESDLDELVLKTGLSIPKTASILLNLELKKKIVCLAGRRYKVV